MYNEATKETKRRFLLLIKAFEKKGQFLSINIWM